MLCLTISSIGESRIGEIVSSNFVGKGSTRKRPRRGLPTSAKASRRIVVRASLGNLEFMSPINSCDFADRFSDLGSRLPILPSLPVLLLPSFYPLLPFRALFPHRHIPAFHGFFPLHESLLACGQFATYYQVIYRGRFVITGSSTLQRSYNSCALVAAIRTDRNVTLIFYILVNMRRQLIPHLIKQCHKNSAN